MTTVFNLNRYDKIVANDLSLNGTISTALGGLSQWEDSGSDIYFSGGNVGIGTTSPSNKLTISGGAIQLSPYASGTTNFAMYSEGDVFQLNPRNSSGAFNNISGLNMSSDGNVGIGTTSPIPKVDVNGAVFLRNQNLTFHSGGGGGNTTEDVALVFNQGGSNRTLALKTDGNGALIGTTGGGGTRGAMWSLAPHGSYYFNGGNVGIGTSSPSYPLHINNAVGASLNATYFRKDYGIQNPNSNVSFQVSLFASAGLFCNGIIGATSDRRIKQDIVEIDDDTALNQIRLIKPSRYNYIDTPSRGTDQVIGFIAQEVEEAIPQAVKQTTGDIPNIMIMGAGSVDSSNNYILTIPDYDTSSLEVDASGNIFTKLKIIIDNNDSDKELYVSIQEVVSATELKVEILDNEIT